MASMWSSGKICIDRCSSGYVWNIVGGTVSTSLNSCANPPIKTKVLKSSTEAAAGEAAFGLWEKKKQKKTWFKYTSVALWS